ncbi:MAG: hypothetical protein WKG06_40105 [Segetibacter sp.]
MKGVKDYLGLKDVLEKPQIQFQQKRRAKSILCGFLEVREKNEEPVIRSRNPDLRRLDSVLKNKEATISQERHYPIATLMR